MRTVWVLDREALAGRGAAYELEFDETRPPMEGGEGVVFFSRDNQYVLKFYREHIGRSKDPKALTQIIMAAPEPNDPRFKLFGFPLGLLIDSPQTMNFQGILMRNVMQECWLEELIWYDHVLRFRGLAQDKPDKMGTFRGRVKAAIEIADAISYLNFKGFAQGDISGRNFLINPELGHAVLIDLDGLVVPGFMESSVLGTPGYMAPELVAGLLDGNPVRPTILSDRHALATVLFGLLLMHHPLLDGAMPALASDANEDKLLRMGTKALYVHHPTDKRNAAHPNLITPAILGEEMDRLFHNAFVEGLFNPAARPQHVQWKTALQHLFDDLIDCKNPNCFWGAFPSKRLSVTICPMCGTAASINAVHGTAIIMVADGRDGGFFSLKQGRVLQLPGDGVVSVGQIFGSNDSTHLLRFFPRSSGWALRLAAEPDTKINCFIMDLHGNGDPQPLTHHDVNITPNQQVFIKHRDKGVRLLQIQT